MRKLPGFALLFVAGSAFAQDVPYRLFPDIRQIEGKQYFEATVVSLTTTEAFRLLWRDPAKLNKAIDKRLADGSAKPLGRVAKRVEPGEDFEAGIGGEITFRALTARDRSFGELPMVIPYSTGTAFVGTQAKIEGGQLAFSHDLHAPKPWVWQNGTFWGGGEFSYLHRSTFEVKTMLPPPGVAGFLGAAEMRFATVQDGEPRTCLLFTRRSGAPGDDAAAKPIEYLRLDAVTFATRDRAIIARLLLRSGPADDGLLFDRLADALSAGKSQICALQSLVSRSGIRGRVGCSRQFITPCGFEPAGGTNREARSYVPENFRAIPNNGGKIEFGSSLENDLSIREGDMIEGYISIKQSLENPVQTRIKTDPSLATAEDPNAIGAVQQYLFDTATPIALKPGTTRLAHVQRADQFRSEPERAGEWRFTFVRSVLPFPTK